jgi:hypothetical protein
MPLDPNALFTFGIPAAVIGSLVWRRTRPAKPVEQRPAVALPEVKEGDTLPARAWLDYVNSQPQTVPHLAVIGPSGSRKNNANHGRAKRPTWPDRGHHGQGGRSLGRAAICRH